MTSKGKNIIIVLMVICLLIAVRGYADDKAGVKIDKNKAAKEVLVASFIDNKDIGGAPSWCGNDRFMFRGNLISFNGQKIHVIRANEGFYGCTPDGKWVLYVDEANKREYRDIWGTVPDEIVDDPYTWRTTVVDLYRYEVDTGARQKVAVVAEFTRPSISPDGAKIFLAERPEIVMDMPKPELEIVWPANGKKLDTRSIYWFSDSSGIVADIYRDYSSRGFSVASFGEDGYVKAYSLEKLGLPPELQKGRFYLIGTDEDNSIYFIIEKPLNDDESKYYIFSYDINGKKTACESKGSFYNKWRHFFVVGILPGGDFLLVSENNCIWSYAPGDNQARCIVDKHYGSETYDHVHISWEGMSPDGKKILFVRNKAIEKSNGKGTEYRIDVFIKNFSKKQGEGIMLISDGGTVNKILP